MVRARMGIAPIRWITLSAFIIVSLAIAISGGQVWATILITLMAVVLGLHFNSVDHKISPDLDPGARWLADRLGDALHTVDSTAVVSWSTGTEV